MAILPTFSSSPEGRNIPAQGNALGIARDEMQKL